MLKQIYKILLVEDDVPTRNRFRDVINSHSALEVTAAVGSISEAIEILELQQPDVMLTDLGLPDGDGTLLIKDIYQRGYSTDVMVITVFGDERHIVGALEAGATGYILKDGTSDYIGNSIIQLINGGSPISAPIARVLLKRFNQIETNIPEASNTVVPHLTARESEVLDLLAKGYSFNEIAELLEISSHTVTSHVKHIYRKLAVKSRSEAVFEAFQLGLVNINT